MSTPLKIASKKSYYRNQIIKALHIQTEEMDTKVADKLSYEYYINSWINTYYHYDIPPQQAITLLYNKRNYIYKSITDKLR